MKWHVSAMYGIIGVMLHVSAYAEGNVFDGLNVRIGLNTIASYNTEVMTLGKSSSVEDKSYLSQDFLGFSVGSEYMLTVSPKSAFEFGPGIFYNPKQTLEWKYENNSMTTTNSYQKEVMDYSNVVVYLGGKYHFPTASSLQSYLLMRTGYSFNKMDNYSFMRYIQSDPPVEWGGKNQEFGNSITDVNNGLYYAVGFGVSVKDHWFIEPVYSYSHLKYMAKLVTSSEERFHADNHSMTLNIGYHFGSHSASYDDHQEGREEEQPKSWVSGFNFQLGVNNCLPIQTSFIHHGFDKFTSDGSQVQSEQTIAYTLENSMTYILGMEYMRPFLKHFSAGLGVQYNSPATYENEIAQPSNGSGDRVFYLRDYYNVGLYGGAKYYFTTFASTTPYLIGRIGYSFNRFNDAVDKYKDKEGNSYAIDKVSMDDGIYWGAGLGIQLNKYLSTELMYHFSKFKLNSYYMEADRSGNPVYQGDELQDVKAQRIQLMIGLKLPR